jgi:hypothetical protein
MRKTKAIPFTILALTATLLAFSFSGCGSNKTSGKSGGKDDDNAPVAHPTTPKHNVFDVASSKSKNIVRLTRLSSGRLVLATHESFALLEPDGTFVNDFGTEGWVKLWQETGTELDELVVDAQDRILVASHAQNGFDPHTVRVHRFTQNGELDPSFAQDGVFTLTFPKTGSFDSMPPVLLALRGENILVATHNGNPLPESGDYYPKNLYTVLLDSSGNKVSTYGTDGVSHVASDFFRAGTADGITDVSFDSQGRIYFGSRSSVGLRDDGASTSRLGACIIRLTANGELDPTFSVFKDRSTYIGKTLWKPKNVLEDEWFFAPTQFFSGYSIVTGRVEDRAVLAKMLENGTLDTSFGKDGYINTDVVDTRGCDLQAMDSEMKTWCASHMKRTGSEGKVWNLQRIGADGKEIFAYNFEDMKLPENTLSTSHSMFQLELLMTEKTFVIAGNIDYANISSSNWLGKMFVDVIPKTELP